MLDHPSRDLDAFPNMGAPSIWIRDGRTVMAMQTTTHICEEATWPLADPAHVFMRDKPTGAFRDNPKAAQISCLFLPSKYIVQIFVDVKRGQLVGAHGNLVEVPVWKNSRVAAQSQKRMAQPNIHSRQFFLDGTVDKTVHGSGDRLGLVMCVHCGTHILAMWGLARPNDDFFPENLGKSSDLALHAVEDICFDVTARAVQH